VPSNDQAVLLAYARFYDQRGGGIETEFREDRQGLSLGKRNKRHFEGQAVLVQLVALAHNVLEWAKHWLSENQSGIADLGLKRLVREVFGISGKLSWNEQGQIWQLELNVLDRLTAKLQSEMSRWLNLNIGT
jgi:hypothetical protein